LQQTPAVPETSAEIEETKPGEIARRNGESARSIVSTESHESGFVLTLQWQREKRMKDFGIDPVPARFVNTEEKQVKKESGSVTP
jgi:hypothetical protein